MRFQEFNDGISLPLSIEEDHIIEQIEISNDDRINRKDLNDREVEIARKMVSRGILTRFKINNDVFYKKTSNHNLEK